MFISQTFKDALGRRPLLLWNQFVSFEDLIDNPGETVQLRPVSSKNARSLSTTHAFNENSVTNASIQIDVL